MQVIWISKSYPFYAFDVIQDGKLIYQGATLTEEEALQIISDIKEGN